MFMVDSLCARDEEESLVSEDDDGDSEAAAVAVMFLKGLLFIGKFFSWARLWS